MSLTLDEIHAEALSLPEESRAELVERLMATLGHSLQRRGSRDLCGRCCSPQA